MIYMFNHRIFPLNGPHSNFQCGFRINGRNFTMPYFWYTRLPLSHCAISMPIRSFLFASAFCFHSLCVNIFSNYRPYRCLITKWGVFYIMFTPNRQFTLAGNASSAKCCEVWCLSRAFVFRNNSFRFVLAVSGICLVWTMYKVFLLDQQLWYVK